jgi:hypothetical protein
MFPEIVLTDYYYYYFFLHGRAGVSEHASIIYFSKHS